MRDYVYLYDLDWVIKPSQDREYWAVNWENDEQRAMVVETLTQGIYPLAPAETP